MVQNKKTSKISAKNTLPLRAHVVKSLVSVTPHAHTGKAVHRRHTSHGVLMVALLLTGILLFSNLGQLHASGLTGSGSQTVTVNVAGNPPTVGADITYPAQNTTTKSPQIEVSGSCEASTMVATYNNGVFAGSSICASNGTYTTVISLNVGTNVLQSQNYDAANQPGPVTGQVTITRIQDPAVVAPETPNETNTTTSVPQVATTPRDVAPNPDPTPASAPPAPQPAENPCFDSSKSTGLDPGVPTIITNCITRSIQAGETITLPVRVTGGVTPYSLTIDWGDGKMDVKNVLDTEYHYYQHTYEHEGIINIGLKTTDKKGVSTFLQTVVQVNGDGGTGAGNSSSPLATIGSRLKSVWADAPVPLYWAAVMLVVGFWVGDLFERRFDKRTRASRAKRGGTPPNRHRHA